MNKAIKIIEQEVKWHQENKNITSMSKDWEEGFVKGCEHCLCVLVTAEFDEDAINVKRIK